MLIKLLLCHHGEIKIRRCIGFSEKMFDLEVIYSFFVLITYMITFASFILAKLKLLCGDAE